MYNIIRTPEVICIFFLQKSQGHIECTLEINAGPQLKDQRNKLTIQLIFKYHKSLEGCKLNTFLSITKPLSEINITLSFIYHLTGATHKAEAKIQYATGKDHHFTN
jgi:hypothetical protein